MERGQARGWPTWALPLFMVANTAFSSAKVYIFKQKSWGCKVSPCLQKQSRGHLPHGSPSNQHDLWNLPSQSLISKLEQWRSVYLRGKGEPVWVKLNLSFSWNPGLPQGWVFFSRLWWRGSVRRLGERRHGHPLFTLPPLPGIGFNVAYFQFAQTQRLVQMDCWWISFTFKQHFCMEVSHWSSVSAWKTVSSLWARNASTTCLKALPPSPGISSVSLREKVVGSWDPRGWCK